MSIRRHSGLPPVPVGWASRPSSTIESRPERPTYASHYRSHGKALLFILTCLLTLAPSIASAQDDAHSHDDQPKSITNSTIELPSREDVIRLLTLADYNTRIVIFGTMLLGLATGVIGTFMLLRKRSLMGDAVSHATFPGITVAFMVMVGMGGNGKSLPGLLIGALVAGLAGMVVVLLIRNTTRLKEDAALGIVLSVFFGLGIAFLGIIQKMPDGSAAGLERFIYGQTASMLKSDAELFAASALVITLVSVLLFKEFTVLCFDPEFAGSQGLPTIVLDTVMMSLVVAVTVIGLQAVGMILIIALLIIPSAAARFWTDHLLKMIIGAAVIGAASGFIGACLSALFAHLPAGAIIVLVASFMFGISMCFGPARGIVFRLIEHLQLEEKVARQHLMREMYEALEEGGGEESGQGVTIPELLHERSWSPSKLNRLLKKQLREGNVYCSSKQQWHLSKEGLIEARRVVRNHRLWEIYLVTHADIAPSHVDRDADQIEHVLGRSLVARLEGLLSENYPHLTVPASPHLLNREGVRV